MQRTVFELQNILRSKLSADNIIYSIQLECYFSYLTKEKDFDFKSLDFSNHKSFNELILDETAKNKDSKINELLKDIIVSNNLSFCDELNETYQLLLKLNTDSLLEVFENIGNSYRAGFTGISMNTTEQDISKFICELNKDREVNSIIDLCSGTGTFLNECSKEYRNSNLNGIEINYNDYLLSRIRLEMQDALYEIINDDVFGIEMSEKYDLVFCNYPWMLKYSKDVKKDPNSLVDFTEIKHRADWSFVSKAINSMSENGKAYVIMPNGCLFNLIESKYRQEIVDKELVEMIISMPSGTISGTSVNYSLIVFSKNNKEIKMVNGTDCFIKERNQIKLDVQSLLDIIRLDSDDKVKCIDKNQIAQNEYLLNVPKYFEQKITIPNPIQLSEIAETFRGYQYNSKQVKEMEPGEGEYSVIKIGDLNESEIDYSQLASLDAPNEKVDKYLLKENDILLSTKGTSIKLSYISDLGEKKLLPSGNITVIRVNNKKVIPLYLYIFLKSDTGSSLLNSTQTGSIIISIPKKALDEMSIPAVDMDIQEVIVNKYNLLNNQLIELKKKSHLIEEKLSLIYETEVGD